MLRLCGRHLMVVDLVDRAGSCCSLSTKEARRTGRSLPSPRRGRRREEDDLKKLMSAWVEDAMLGYLPQAPSTCHAPVSDTRREASWENRSGVAGMPS